MGKNLFLLILLNVLFTPVVKASERLDKLLKDAYTSVQQGEKNFSFHCIGYTTPLGETEYEWFYKTESNSVTLYLDKDKYSCIVVQPLVSTYAILGVYSLKEGPGAVIKIELPVSREIIDSAIPKLLYITPEIAEKEKDALFGSEGNKFEVIFPKDNALVNNIGLMREWNAEVNAGNHLITALEAYF